MHETRLSLTHLISTIDPAQKTTAYEYNARSQMTAVVDAINQHYEFVYDPLGRVTQNKKGATTMSFVYDAAGNRGQRTDYNGAVTNYSYDSLNRLTTISYPDTTATFNSQKPNKEGGKRNSILSLEFNLGTTQSGRWASGIQPCL
jgi:YD repeat-containing protein